MRLFSYGLLCVLCASACAAGKDFAYGGHNHFNFITFDGGFRWPAGKIPWRYNPAGQPAAHSTDDYVAALKRAAASWSRGCTVEFEYLGLSEALAGNNDGVSVIAWRGPLSVNSSFGGFAQTYSKQRPLIDEADVWLNSAFFSGLDWVEGLGAHELGHVLGLAHSNNPDSILFSQPYHPWGFDRAMRGDDISGCARLYGSTGVAAPISTQAPRTPQLAAKESVRLYLADSLSNLSYNNPPAPGLASIPADGREVYFLSYFDGFKVGDKLTFELILPDNTVYHHFEIPTEFPTAYYFTTLGSTTKGMQFFPGTWRFSFLVNGIPKGESTFTVPAAAAVPPVPDIAWVAQPGSTGRFSLSARNLSPERGVLAYQWGINDSEASGETVQATLQAGARNTVRLFAVSSNPRSGSGGSEQGTGPDNVRTGRFDLPASGSLSSPAFVATASGLAATLSLEGQVTLPVQDAGERNIYVAVALGSSFIFRVPGGWSTTPLPLLAVTAPAVAAFSLLDGLDTRGLPSGTAIYLGYGRSVEDVVQTGRFGEVYRF